jgi:hypothetical protein
MSHEHGRYQTWVGTVSTAERETISIEDALEDAWSHARNSGYHQFRIVEIRFTADNPINEYSVIITPV